MYCATNRYVSFLCSAIHSGSRLRVDVPAELFELLSQPRLQHRVATAPPQLCKTLQPQRGISARQWQTASAYPATQATILFGLPGQSAQTAPAGLISIELSSPAEPDSASPTQQSES